MEKIQYIKNIMRWRNFSNSFNVKIDLITQLAKTKSLYTSHMTNILDDRVIKFYDKNKATAKL